MQFDVLTPHGCVLSGDATEVTIPTKMGQMTILENHIPVIAGLDVGLMRIVSEGQAHTFAVDGGFIEVAKSRVSIVTETALTPQEVDVEGEEAKLSEINEALSRVSELNPAEIELKNRELKRCDSFLDIAKNA